MNEKTALIFDLYRGTTHDGPGLRTTVFFKGCPLRCVWCHNPEGISTVPVKTWDVKLCVGCMNCRDNCPSNAIIIAENGISFAENCQNCFKCISVCPAEALKKSGKKYTVDELFSKVVRDKNYFEVFGGGVTISGGEPLMQADFAADFFRRLKNGNISTALDTCGMVNFSEFEKILPYTDIVLYDMKLFDADEHLKYTGSSNTLIKENLLKLVERNTRLWIRTPLIPGITATEKNIRNISRFLMTELDGKFERYELCAFNSACADKYCKLNRTWELANISAMDKNVIENIRNFVLSENIPEAKIVFSGIITN